MTLTQYSLYYCVLLCATLRVVFLLPHSEVVLWQFPLQHIWAGRRMCTFRVPLRTTSAITRPTITMGIGPVGVFSPPGAYSLPPALFPSSWTVCYLRCEVEAKPAARPPVPLKAPFPSS